MKPRKKQEDKRIKISITLTPKINNHMNVELINKSKLIDKLLRKHYGFEDL